MGSHIVLVTSICCVIACNTNSWSSLHLLGGVCSQHSFLLCQWTASFIITTINSHSKKVALVVQHHNMQYGKQAKRRGFLGCEGEKAHDLDDPSSRIQMSDMVVWLLSEDSFPCSWLGLHVLSVRLGLLLWLFWSLIWMFCKTWDLHLCNFHPSM